MASKVSKVQWMRYPDFVPWTTLKLAQLVSSASVQRIPYAYAVPFDSFDQDAFGIEILRPPFFKNASRTIRISNFDLHFSFTSQFPQLTALSSVDINELSKQINSENSISIPVTALLYSDQEDYQLFEKKNLNLIFKFRKCTRGEYFELKTLECLACEENFYSFDMEFLEPSFCRSCSLESFNCYGGFNLTPKASYWRWSYWSTNFIKCPNSEGNTES